METIENFIKFIASYPVWARVAVILAILAIAAILVFAPRVGGENGQGAVTPNRRVYMRINPIQLFPDNPQAEVSLSAFVNSTEYVHPSIGGIEWMQVGPQMSIKIFEIPRADRYDVRFVLRLRSGANLESQQQQSQEIQPVVALPFSGRYSLHQVNNKSRSAGVSAVVAYDIFEL